jgi:AcrR family transcriptional regulator
VALKSRGRQGPRTNEEWSRATIDALIRRARREFAEAGYDGASVERIAEEAELTKGSVYYHFRNKAGLFEAVLRDVQREIVERIEKRAVAASDPREAVVAGCEAFLEVALDDELRQIALADGPRVLGWSQWRAIDAEFGLGSLKDGLRACKRTGALARVDVDTLAHLISGALNEAAFLVAESNARNEAHASAARTVRWFVRSLLG